jgi:hypothetical protein
LINIDIEENSFSEKIWRIVNIQCPICKISQKVEIPECIISQSKQLTSISIPKYRVCEHKFITVVDKNFIVRGYQKIDFEVDEENFTNKFKSQTIELKAQDVDSFTIKLNIHPEILLYAINGCIFKIKVIILLDNELHHLDKKLIDFFNFIFQDSFDINILIKSIDNNLNEIRPLDEQCIILDRNKILKNHHKKTLSNEHLNFEYDIVKQFYKEGDSYKSIIFLRDKIREIFSLSLKLVEYYERQKGKPLKQKYVINFLENTHFLKLNKDYFNFLTKIVKDYFNVDLIFIQDIIANQIDHMWSKSKK